VKTRLSDAPSIRFSFYHGLLINNLVELDSPLVAVTLAAPGNLENPGIETLFSILTNTKATNKVTAPLPLNHDGLRGKTIVD
jgi:hypothetical protein